MTDIPYATIIEACWSIAGKRGLDGLTPAAIADEAAIDAPRMQQLFPTQSHVLRALMHDVFASVNLNTAAPTITSSSPLDNRRDNLFDLIMAHFDALQTHRPAVVRLYQDIVALRHLELMVRLRKSYWQQVDRVLVASGITTDDLLGFGKVSLLALLGLWLLPVWVNDESEDLSKTMSALDQGLQRLGDINNTITSFGC